MEAGAAVRIPMETVEFFRRVVDAAPSAGSRERRLDEITDLFFPRPAPPMDPAARKAVMETMRGRELGQEGPGLRKEKNWTAFPRAKR